MDVSEFRLSILDKGIRGELVPQIPTNETSNIWLQRVDDYKSKLIAKKKIKLNKKSSRIIKKGQSYYLLNGEQEKNIDKELPFCIPNTWTWVNLSQISLLINGDRGKNYPGREYWTNSGVPFINAGALGDNYIKKSELNYIPEERFDLLRAGFVEPNDILYCLRGSLGKVAINDLEKGAIASSIVIIRPFDLKIVKYLYYVFISNYGRDLIEKVSGGTAQPNLAAKNVADYMIPIPPIEEQKQIVKAIETCFSFADLVEKRQKLVEEFKADLGVALLDLAVKGELCEQRSIEESMTSTYQRLNIMHETLTDLPYNLPKGWIWTKLKSISESIKAGGDKPEVISFERTDEFPYPIYANGIKQNGLYGYSKEAKVTKESLTVSARGTIGFSVIRREPYTPIIRLISIVPKLELVSVDYLKVVFDAFYSESDGNGTSIPQLTVPKIKENLLPLPPLDEQRRIVDIYYKLVGKL